jgi:hypothetical protein
LVANSRNVRTFQESLFTDCQSRIPCFQVVIVFDFLTQKPAGEKSDGLLMVPRTRIELVRAVKPAGF